MDGIGCLWSLCPGHDKSEKWTSQMWKKQIARLEAAQEYDHAAIAPISQALEPLEQEVAERPPAGDGLKVAPEK